MSHRVIELKDLEASDVRQDVHEPQDRASAAVRAEHPNNVIQAESNLKPILS